MAQETLPLNQIDAQTAGWETLLNANADNTQQYISTFLIALDGAVGATTANIDIQLEDAAGNAVTDTQYFLRVRISDSGGVTNATNATVAVRGSTTLQQSFTSSKDILVKSDAAGLVELTVTDATDEIVTLNIGPSEVNPLFANYHNPFNIDFS